MRCIQRLAAGLALAAPFAIAGCGGAGDEDKNPAGPNAAPAGEPAQAPGAAAGTAEGTPGEAELVTPQRVVDPKSLVDVVKAEVEGGEAERGPTPDNLLWLPADLSIISDEPMTIAVPTGFPPLLEGFQIPLANKPTKGKYELGKQLYFDPRLSKDGTVSCATCHNPEKGWTDQMPSSTGIFGQVGARSAPTVLNTAYGKQMFWDGRAPSLEGQAQGPIQNKIEMGDQSYEEIIERLRQIPSYGEQFRKVFGTDVTLDGVAKAIATFERTVLTGDAPYDKYIAGDMAALDESQKRGMVLFGLSLMSDDEFEVDKSLQKKANCTACHVGFNFTDDKFHNLGVGWDESTSRFADLGRFVVEPIGAKDPAHYGAFKTPTLRDIERTGPYMHDGSEATLEEVVDYYDKGGNPNPALDVDMKPLKLTDQEKADLVAFMKALTGKEVMTVELPTLPPGPDGQSPDPRKALEPPSPPKAAMGGLELHGLAR